MKKVIAYGTFDYFHYGHYNFLKQAKDKGDYLVVGVSTDSLCLQKGKICFLNQEKRAEIIKSLKFVDEVIFENSFQQKISDVSNYGISIYCDGEDYKDIFPKTKEYLELLKLNCEIVFLKRTPGVSSTEIKEKIVKQFELDSDTDSLRTKTNIIRKDKFDLEKNENKK